MKVNTHATVGPAGFVKAVLVLMVTLLAMPGSAQDLAEVRENGVLRHLGVPYARFVSGGGESFVVEIVRPFARHIGVPYEYVPAEWTGVIQDLPPGLALPGSFRWFQIAQNVDQISAPPQGGSQLVQVGR